MNITERIRRTAEADPGRTAFVFKNETLSYGQLWHRSGVIAKWIAESGITPGQPIPVYGHKNGWMPVCFLACTRSGHAYVPMDTCMSLGRIRDIAAAVGSRMILSAENDRSEAGKHGLADHSVSEVLESLRADYDILDPEKMEIVLNFAEGIRQKGGNYCIDPGQENRAEDVQYIIFTSGSTGKPKGVQITRRNLEAYLDFSEGLIEPGGHHVFLNQAPFHFDLSVMDTWTGLATGSAVACVDHGMIEELNELMAFLNRAQITDWVSTPSFAELCLGCPEFRQELLPDLRTFLFCGEALGKQTAGRLKERFPRTRVINTYGPTETTVCVTAVEITEEMIRSENLLPVGYPKKETGIYAADSSGRRLAAGERGEIVITGDTVSAGYFRDPERTMKRFFRTESSQGIAQRAFRTGDLGYVDEQGMVYMMGRMDSQIKMKGYRIELGDIEANLQKLEGVSGAAVFPQVKDGQIRSLAACVLQSREEDQSYARRKWIRRTLGSMLPSYMVPRKILFFDSFPMTSNGKLDRRKLEAMI